LDKHRESGSLPIGFTGEEMKVGDLIRSNGYLGVVMRQGNGLNEGMWEIYWFDDCYTFVSENYKDVEIVG